MNLHLCNFYEGKQYDASILVLAQGGSSGNLPFESGCTRGVVYSHSPLFWGAHRSMRAEVALKTM